MLYRIRHRIRKLPTWIHLILILILSIIAFYTWWIRSDMDPPSSGPCPNIWSPELPARSPNQSQDSTLLRPVYCDRLFRGDSQEITYAEQFKWCMHKDRISDDQYVDLTRRCSWFKSNYGYTGYTVTDDEQDFPIAFSILMHENVEQMERLLRMIYRPHNFYCIHADLKASQDVQNAVRTIAGCFDNVLIAHKQIAVRWAEFTVLEAELSCMETLWKESKKWKYFINLTGRDFPLKTNYELVQILRSYNGANDIDGTPHR